MKPIVRALAATLLALSATTTWAHGDIKCSPKPLAKEEWRSHTDLEKKLVGEGWTIRQMKTTPTCYEVYGKDPKGKRVEAFFHPKTLERVEE